MIPVTSTIMGKITIISRVIKPFMPCGEASQCKKMAVVQASKELHFCDEAIVTQRSQFFYQRYSAILKFSIISRTPRIAVDNSVEPTGCPLYFLVPKTLHI